MKMIVYIQFIFVFGLISCEKAENIQQGIFPYEYRQIIGTWQITSISGGFFGQEYEPNFKYLNIEHNGRFTFLYEESILAKGIIQIENQNDQTSFRFTLDDGYDLAVVNMALYYPKSISKIDSEILIFADPCCDLFTYTFESR